MQRSIAIRGQFLALSSSSAVISRTVTDIPWHKVGDETHLHVVDSRSTRRKFDMKLEKMEKEKINIEHRRQNPNSAIKPSELKPINIPQFIDRGPSDILR